MPRINLPWVCGYRGSDGRKAAGGEAATLLYVGLGVGPAPESSRLQESRKLLANCWTNCRSGLAVNCCVASSNLAQKARKTVSLALYSLVQAGGSVDAQVKGIRSSGRVRRRRCHRRCVRLRNAQIEGLVCDC
ncbi:hypothetical protein CDV31_017306 [Fusarium ambrosium]|uniref:Uncharacterized protein n=1 Tax=Fusarium ambrosium TaxID=131363 RepID=A0A428RJW2_9HYPO|nr:hypothetical protein CDV31_017306 [Fusarium ambrosium]